MAKTDDYIILPTDLGNTGANLHVRVVNIGGVDHVENVHQLADSDNNTVARVLTADPAAGDAGLAVRVIPGSGAAALGKAEDAAHASGDVGVYFLTVRQDTPASSTSADGDYQSAKTDSLGCLWVNVRTGTVELGSASLAALESITVGGTVELGATSLAALESITATGPLTDTQLRASAVLVTGTGGTFPVTDSGGSLTVDAPVAAPVFVRLSDGAAAVSPALDATLTGGTAKSILRGGAKGTTAAADVTSTASGANHNAADVILYDALGNVLNPQNLSLIAGAAPGATNPLPVRPTDGTSFIDPRSIRALTSADVVSVIGANDVNHDVADTSKVDQIGGYASNVDVPPTPVTAAGNRVRAWFDKSGAQVARRRKLRESYTSVCRLAETAARLDPTFTFTANTNKQLVTFHHAASAVKDIRIQKVVVYVNLLGTAAGFFTLELRAITGTPATGNPAITPKAHHLGAAATEAVCLVLPTTAGTDATANSPYGSFTVDHGIEATTQPTAHPLPQGLTAGYAFTLYDASQEDDEVLPIVLRAGTLEGVAIVGRDTAATVLRFWAVIKHTEETP